MNGDGSQHAVGTDSVGMPQPSVTVHKSTDRTALCKEVLAARGCASTIGISLLGVPPSDWSAIVAAITPVAKRERLLPIFIVDDFQFSVLRRHKVIFEFMPSTRLRGRSSDELEWSIFQLRRLDRIKSKWAFRKIVRFGNPSETDTVFLRQE